MLEFLKTYSISDILIFLVMFALAFKGVITFWDWGVERLRKIFNKEYEEKNSKTAIQKLINSNAAQMKELMEKQDTIIEEVKNIKSDIKLLTDADQADIKAWITEKHHLFCYEKKYIDDYNLDCIEKRYHYYTLEGGNSFIADLMKEIRQLPKQPPNE